MGRNTGYLSGTVGKLWKEFSDLNFVYFNAAGDSVSWVVAATNLDSGPLHHTILEKVMDVHENVLHGIYFLTD
jgi:hypothetical protein